MFTLAASGGTVPLFLKSSLALIEHPHHDEHAEDRAYLSMDQLVSTPWRTSCHVYFPGSYLRGFSSKVPPYVVNRRYRLLDCRQEDVIFTSCGMVEFLGGL